MMIVPYLHFENGVCEAAITRYAEVFGGEIDMMMRWSDAPPEMQAAPEHANWVMHSSVRIGEARLMASDSPPPHGEPQKGVSISVSMPDEETARAAFDALMEGGEPIMPFQETFFAKGFGMLKDRFGTHWMISTGEQG